MNLPPLKLSKQFRDYCKDYKLKIIQFMDHIEKNDHYTVMNDSGCGIGRVNNAKEAEDYIWAYMYGYHRGSDDTKRAILKAAQEIEI